MTKFLVVLSALSAASMAVHGWTPLLNNVLWTRSTTSTTKAKMSFFMDDAVEASTTEPLMTTASNDVTPSSTMEEQDKAGDHHEQFVTTKTNKQLVFDATTSRFFETSLEPAVPFQESTISWTTATTSRTNTEKTSVSFSYDTTKYAPTDMVPTSELFGTTTVDDHSSSIGGNNNYNYSKNDPNPLTTTSTIVKSNNDPNTLQDNNKKNNDNAFSDSNPVFECYDAWNRRDMMLAVECFDSNFFYQDSLYVNGPITDPTQLQRHWERQAALLPAQSQLVVDHWVIDDTCNSIAAEWHVERKDGTTVPLTRGISLYKLNAETGKIKSGFRVSEMLVKPSKSFADGLVESTKRILAISRPSRRPSRGSKDATIAATATTSPFDSSIVEKYYEAWNRRDIESALDCFVDDCFYQTEDPVFTASHQGKEALRAHLQQNDDTLPRQSRIVLDQVVIDRRGQGTIATEWHLKVGGVQIPNLRGCAMYTVDRPTGLLQTGYDVAEAPVKIPREILPSLLIPAKFLFR